MYKYLLKPILFLLDPEFIHDCFICFGEFLGRFWITRRLVSLIYGYRHGENDKPIIIDGIHYSSRVLLAAGFDYNGRLTQILPCVGFAGEEIGSVTAKPCEGNPKPRLTRLSKAKSIRVNKGLRNEGVDAVIKRLKSALVYPQRLDLRGPTSTGFVLGISIARTNDSSSNTIESGIADYMYSFQRLNEENVGDYYTINISCPNSFGGEAFAKPELLRQLLANLAKISTTKPVYIKMPINLTWDQFKPLIDVIRDYRWVKGVIIGNLNKDYSSLGINVEIPDEYAGGLSGKPCESLSNTLIRQTREYVGKDFTIIGVGGIFSAEDAKKKIDAGANLVQLITGMIYEGPGLIGKICRGWTST